MIIIWRGPAMLITILSIVVSVLLISGIQFIFQFEFDDDIINILVMTLSSIGMLIGDTYYRKGNHMSMFSLKASTIFFILPTWIVGAAFLSFNIFMMYSLGIITIE